METAEREQKIRELEARIREQTVADAIARVARVQDLTDSMQQVEGDVPGASRWIATVRQANQDLLDMLSKP